MTVKVQAKSDGVSKYTFALYISEPIEFFGVQITSAAIVAFQVSPIEVVAAAVKYGLRAGI